VINTYNNSQDDEDFVPEIAGHALTALNNPAVGGSVYWNLNTTTFGSAGFQAAWGYSTGAGVTIGIVDEGVNYAHLDLAANYDQSLDFDPLDLDASDARPDTAGETHGTEVAGVIVGSGANDFGSIGAAPDATIAASYLRYGQVSIDGLVAILSHQSNFDISNNSWGFTSAFADNANADFFAPVADAIEGAATTGRDGLGTAMVFAAGNGKLSIAGQNIGDDSNFHSLSNNRFSIAVGAHDKTGEAAFFSSPGTNILVSAPGVALLTTSGHEDGATGSTYVSGTSFAAPMVSSAIALMLQANPNLGYRDIQEILAISSDPSRSGLAVGNGATNVNGGGMLFDREMGFGALNALSAVSLARSWTSQHTADNEEHISADFVVPVTIDPLSQTLTVDVINPGTDDFSLDFVELTLTIEDADLANLRIELISADGTSTLIAPNLRAAGGRTTLDFTFSSVATWGESPFGTWTLKLSHPGASSDFTIAGARLDLYGDIVTADDDHIFTASYARLVAADATRQVITDADGGVDRLNFAAAAAAVSVNLSSGTGAIGTVGFGLSGTFENIYGSIHADLFVGSSDSNLIDGDFGNDTIAGLEGDDFLNGGAGADFIIGGFGADFIDGGAGIDTAAYDSEVTLDFATGVHLGEAAGDLFVRIERFHLSAGNDFFIGSLAAVDDNVKGNAGADYLDGGAGNDRLDGGIGADTMIGGAGDDTFVFDDAADLIWELAGEGTDTILSSRSMTLAANVENLELLGSARHGTGNGLANEILGNGENNRLRGEAGDDWLDGRKGNDRIEGGKGNDTIVGGKGRDVLTGDGGRDHFVFTSANGPADRITDFRRGHDKIDLSGIDANKRTSTENKFKFIGDRDFGDKAGQLRFDHKGDTTIITADLNGNDRADFKIILDGHYKLTATDFIL
jgi:Ca2+-binding RTX toxin-like protein/subtilisin family serine protease